MGSDLLDDESRSWGSAACCHAARHGVRLVAGPFFKAPSTWRHALVGPLWWA